MERSFNINLSDFVIQEFLVETAGEHALSIVKACTKEVTDETVADKTHVKINTIRTVLNKLHYLGVVTYTREKNERTNWFTYTWKLRPKRLIELVKEAWEEKLSELENRSSMEENYVYFSCVNGCEKYAFEVAMEYDFKCPRCGGEMKHQDNTKVIRSLKERIKLAKKQLSKL